MIALSANYAQDLIYMHFNRQDIEISGHSQVPESAMAIDDKAY